MAKKTKKNSRIADDESGRMIDMALLLRAMQLTVCADGGEYGGSTRRVPQEGVVAFIRTQQGGAFGRVSVLDATETAERQAKRKASFHCYCWTAVLQQEFIIGIFSGRQSKQPFVYEYIYEIMCVCEGKEEEVFSLNKLPSKPRRSSQPASRAEPPIETNVVLTPPPPRALMS